MSAPRLTAEQLRAVDASHAADTCVVAGPGSGKTTVLVEYFRQLVAGGADPLRILAITFTEKAAGNMRKRLAESFQEDVEIRARLERAWVSTVHGFCARLLRENAIFAGVDPAFTVADERESLRLQQEAITDAVEQAFASHPTAVRALIRGLSSPDFEEALRSGYDAMRGAGQRVETLARVPPAGVTGDHVAATLRALREEPLRSWSPEQRAHLGTILEDGDRVLRAATPAAALSAIEDFSGKLPKCKRNTPAYDLVKLLKDTQLKDLQYSLISELYAHERQTLLHIFGTFDRIYRDRKCQAGVLDFADLEEFAVRLLEENPDTCTRLQNQFDHVVMDEFQDTNGQQARLLDLIRRPGRFYAVGDINQSIFGFRHAEPDVFRRYRDSVEQNGRLVELVSNFRSRPDILRAVEAITCGAPGIEPRPLVAGREFAESRPISVEMIAASAAEPEAALRIEAQWVARRILELLQGAGPGFEFKDVAVLVRNTEVLGEFSDAFDQAGIPYVVNRGKGFYEAREVKDLVHLLRVIANPRDEISIAAVLRSPLVGVSDEALLRLSVFGKNIGASLLRIDEQTAADFDPEDYGQLVLFRDRLRGWRARREQVSFDRLLLEAIDDCGYQSEVGSRGGGNIEKFLAQARQSSARMTLDRFLEELDLVRASNPREPDAPPEDSVNAVSVMTVHSAKGLEFPIVFIAALQKGVEMNLPVVAFSPQFGLGAGWRNPATGDDKDDLFQHAIRVERKQREREESDRLLYVAMTRAEQHLVLSFSSAGKRPGNWAQVVCERLNLDVTEPRTEILTYRAPSGEPWQLRLHVAAGPPEHLENVAPPEAAERVQYIAPPGVTGQHDTNATVTDLAAFAKCPRLYFLGHYLGFEGRPRKLENSGESPAGDFGTQVHALLAGTPVSEPDSKALALADVFRQSTLGRRVGRASHVEREFDFVMAVHDLVVRGQIDLWFEESGELVIVDYKSDAVTGIEAHQRVFDYAMQLRLYAMAVERVTGRVPHRAFLHFLRPNAVIEVDLRPSLLDSPEQIVRDFLDAQSTLQFPLNEGPHCPRCPFFKDLCPATYGLPKPQNALKPPVNTLNSVGSIAFPQKQV